MTERYWVTTLGCPKNQVDSDKLAGLLGAQGLAPAEAPEDAELVVVNTCAFIEAARQESIDTILTLADERKAGSRLVVTGCLAERHGHELAAALPEVDLVAGFGRSLTAESAPPGTSVPVELRRAPSFDLLNLPRPPSPRPWAYLKVAEGCDRRCGFCAIPSFRGPQRSRSLGALVDEVVALGAVVREIVLVAQDLASFGLDRTDGANRPSRTGRRPLVELLEAVADRAPWVRLLYLYPSSLDDDLLRAVAQGPVPYFDLSLQHVSAPLLRRMRRPGRGARFLETIAAIRDLAPHAALRSSFIFGYPGETESDHDELLAFLEEAQLDWAGFFTWSPEPGTPAVDLDNPVPPDLARERLQEAMDLQDAVTAARRAALVGTAVEVLVDEPGRGRTFREAPEIDGVVHVPADLPVGSFQPLRVVDAAGPDLWAEPGLPSASASPAASIPAGVGR